MGRSPSVGSALFKTEKQCEEARYWIRHIPEIETIQAVCLEEK